MPTKLRIGYKVTKFQVAALCVKAFITAALMTIPDANVAPANATDNPEPGQAPLDEHDNEP